MILGSCLDQDHVSYVKRGEIFKIDYATEAAFANMKLDKEIDHTVETKGRATLRAGEINLIENNVIGDTQLIPVSNTKTGDITLEADLDKLRKLKKLKLEPKHSRKTWDKQKQKLRTLKKELKRPKQKLLSGDDKNAEMEKLRK